MSSFEKRIRMVKIDDGRVTMKFKVPRSILLDYLKVRSNLNFYKQPHLVALMMDEFIKKYNYDIDSLIIAVDSMRSKMLNETVEDIKRYPEYAKTVGLKQAVFMVMTPYPGTPIYEEYKNENAISSYRWDMYNNFGTVVEPNNIDLKTLKKMNHRQTRPSSLSSVTRRKLKVVVRW